MLSNSIFEYYLLVVCLRLLWARHSAGQCSSLFSVCLSQNVKNIHWQIDKGNRYSWLIVYVLFFGSIKFTFYKWNSNRFSCFKILSIIEWNEPQIFSSNKIDLFSTWANAIQVLTILMLLCNIKLFRIQYGRRKRNTIILFIFYTKSTKWAMSSRSKKKTWISANELECNQISLSKILLINKYWIDDFPYKWWLMESFSNGKYQ